MPRASQGYTQWCPSSPFPPVHPRRRPSRDTCRSRLRQSITSEWCCVYGTAAPCPVSPQSQPNGGVTKTTGPTRFLSLVRAKLSYKMATLWDTAGASALRGTSEQMSSFSLHKPPFGGDPPSDGLRRHRWLTARSPRRPHAPSFAGFFTQWRPSSPFPPRAPAATPIPRYVLKPPPSEHH